MLNVWTLAMCHTLQPSITPTVDHEFMAVFPRWRTTHTSPNCSNIQHVYSFYTQKICCTFQFESTTVGHYVASYLRIIVFIWMHCWYQYSLQRKFLLLAEPLSLLCFPWFTHLREYTTAIISQYWHDNTSSFAFINIQCSLYDT